VQASRHDPVATVEPAAAMLAAKIELMRQTAGALATAIRDVPVEVLGRRPAAEAWAATEILCHLRDVEEFYVGRVQLILTNEDPVLPLLEPDRWVRDRQYIRNEPHEALATFRVRREETVGMLCGLTAEQWLRAGRHERRGTLTIGRIVGGWPKHDAEHLAQLRRAVNGLP
jgi:DinB superfamily